MLAIVGPTASGKSHLAHLVAVELGAQIVSADSMQVYRGMDIGTAKPTPAEQEEVPYHLIDVVDPAETFTVADYQRLARTILDGLGDETVIVVGGSGLHFRAVVDELRFPPHDPDLRAGLEDMSDERQVAALLELDPGAGAVMDLANPRRVLRALEVAMLTGETPSKRTSAGMDSYRAHYRFTAIGLDAGESTKPRIEARLERMMAAGLMGEVEGLMGRLSRTAAQAVGYRQLSRVVRGELTLPEGLEATRKATVALARRQRTFFRRDPRITWIPWADDGEHRLHAARVAFSLEARS